MLLCKSTREVNVIAQVTITKSVQWHGHAEEFSNVYHYDTPAVMLDAGWSELIDKIVAAEKLVHSSAVTFVRAKVNGPTDQGEAANVMQFAKDLSGNGTATAQVSMAREAAYVCSFYLGRSQRGYKQILKKFVHSCAIVGATAAAGQETGAAALAAGHKAPLITFMNSIKNINTGSADENNLCNDKGKHLPLASDPTVADYIYTRQFKRGRRRKPQVV